MRRIVIDLVYISLSYYPIMLFICRHLLVYLLACQISRETYLYVSVFGIYRTTSGSTPANDRLPASFVGRCSPRVEICGGTGVSIPARSLIHAR